MTDLGLKGIILHTSGDRHRRIAMQDDFFSVRKYPKCIPISLSP